MTAHVADEVRAAIHDFAKREHLTVDETLHIGMALVLMQGGAPLPPALKLKLKQHRLMSFLPSVPALGD